jgi:hypothetical protein
MNKKSKPEGAKTERIGYRNPPEQTRFKPGQSGNPKGRPKGSLNMATVLERVLREKVIINENGRRKVISKRQAACTQLVNKAASGDLKAVQILTVLERFTEERATQNTASNCATEEVDARVLLGIVERMTATKGDEDPDANKTVSE